MAVPLASPLPADPPDSPVSQSISPFCAGLSSTHSSCDGACQAPSPRNCHQWGGELSALAGCERQREMVGGRLGGTVADYRA